MAKNKISLYLIKDHITEEDDIFKEGYDILHEYSEQKVLYYNPSFISPPKWLGDFFHLTDDNLKIASSKAVLLLRHTIDQVERLFVIVFGHGKYMLNDNILDERFGLITLLNLIDEDQIKRINRTNIGGSKKISDEQVPNTTNINEFGFQVDRDLLKKAYAKIDDEYLGKCMVIGGELFSLTQDKDVNSIEELVEFCYRSYIKEDYKERFDWIDNISPIKDKDLITTLDTTLVEEINQKNNDCVMLALPDLIDWDDIKGFKYSGDRNNIYDDIDLDTFVEIHDAFDDIEQIKHRCIHIVSADEEHSYSDWNAYKCLFAEIEYQNKRYCLSDSKWYEISNDFVESIEDKYNQIPISEFQLQEYNHSNEGDYNEKTTENADDLLCLDRKNVMYGGSRNRIEICDILTADKKLIHIKHNNGSSYMSHLFNQATVSAELLTDSGFRVLANQKIEQDLYKLSDTFNPREYTVIIAVIDKHEGTMPRLPFFSKVSIRYAAQRIQAFGYKVEIMKIPNIKENEVQEET